jgi:ABC-type nitrate/sulfonate/bicarbonate transport system permease component
VEGYVEVTGSFSYNNQTSIKKWIFSLIIFFAWWFFTEAFTRLPQRNLPRPCNLSKHIVKEARYFSIILPHRQNIVKYYFCCKITLEL